MGHRPVEELWASAPRRRRKLDDLGRRPSLTSRAVDVDVMRGRSGPAMGPWYVMLGLGGGTEIDAEPRVPARAAIRRPSRPTSPSAEIEVSSWCWRNRSPRTSVAEGRSIPGSPSPCAPSFFTRTKITKLAEPTIDPAAVAAHARVVLARFELGRPLRLIGVRVVLQMPVPPAAPR